MLNVMGFFELQRLRTMLHRERIEENSYRRCVEPMLTAERDRALLKTVRKLRDHEKELMSDVEGWEVGTWFGQPYFKKAHDREYFNLMTKDDFYAFSKPSHARSEIFYRDMMVL